MTFSHPLPKETFIVGVMGVSLFGMLLLMSLGNLKKASKPLAILFFCTMMLMCFLELPRYVVMIVTRKYESTLAYSCHILASCLYFLSVSLVCFMWAWLLEMGKSSINILYSKTGVLSVNIIVGTVALTMCVLCIMSPDLDDFFHSTAFIVYTSSEVIALVFYSGIVAMFGIRLLLRYVSGCLAGLAYDFLDSKIILIQAREHNIQMHFSSSKMH